MNSHAPRLCWLTPFVLFFAATPALARHVTLRPDGTGDYPTISSVFIAIVEGSVRTDTLILEPGTYDETVKDENCVGVTVYGRAGAESTHVRGFDPGPCSYGAKVVGVTVDERFFAPTRAGYFYTSNSGQWRWEDCVFSNGLEVWGSYDAPTHRCTFRGPSAFYGFNYLNDCSFEGAPVFFRNEIGAVTVRRCTFRGPAEDLVIAHPRDESGMGFVDCTFSDAGNAIRVVSANLQYQGLGASRCRFERLSGAALRYEFTEPLEASRYYANFDLGLADCSISDVEHAVWCQSTHLINLWMARDTISSCRGTAVDATVRSGTIDGVDLRDTRGDGVHLTIQNYFPWPHSYEPSPPAYFEMGRSHVRGCTGDGIRIEQAPNPVWHEQHLAIRNSTIESNDGAGISFEGAQPTVTGCLVRGNGEVGILAIPAGAAPACSLSNNTLVENRRRGIEIKSATHLPSLAVDHNLVTSNRGGGIAALGAFRGAVAMNDVFTNGGADVSGPIPHGGNLEVDPLYCAALEGDFHVRQDSPCGPLGPFGIIGAFGIGCITTTPVAETVRLRSPLDIGPNPVRGPVTFAWTSDRPLDGLELFDVQGRRRWNASGEALHSGPLHWNRTGLGGEHLPAGIYLVRWRAGDQQGSSRLVLLDP